VFAVAADPVENGLVASLAHPGGNATGLANQQTELGGKRLDVLREAIPSLRRLAIIANIVTGPMDEMRAVQATARTLGLEVATFEIRRAEDIAPAFEALKDRAEALYVCSDPLVNANRVRINTLALGARLPTMHGFREYVVAGGCYRMDQTSWTCSGVPPTLSTRFCAERSQPTSRSNSQPSIS
jgi:putative ABC transport system substrate-binding protein